MNDENTLKLWNDFPKLYAGRYKSITESLIPFGFECSDGWFDLIYKLSKEITELDDTVEATQVKEKFGTLRFYYYGGNDKIYRLVEEAEQESARTCEDCGDTTTAKTRGDSWLSTLCDKCAKRNDEIRNNL
jgi:hypothetical protein